MPSSTKARPPAPAFLTRTRSSSGYENRRLPWSAKASAEAVTEGAPVLEQEGVILLCPAVSAEPYEMRIAPAVRESDAFASPLLAVALHLAAEALRRLRAVEPGAPANLWLHDGPWWHIDLVPRLTVAAGIELGAGIHVNPLPPEEAAARLRG